MCPSPGGPFGGGSIVIYRHGKVASTTSLIIIVSNSGYYPCWHLDWPGN
jgi:hypothetical protein